MSSKFLASTETKAKHAWNRSRGSAARPWRLYGTMPDGRHRPLPWRAFGHELNAHNAALIDVRWGDYKIIEVYDVRNGKESGTYYMSAEGDIKFSAPHTSRIAHLITQHKKG